LLLQAAKGLGYLHSLNIPHGNLKESNVVVDESGQARLTDYGLALVNSQSNFPLASPPIGKFDLTWQAPEIVKSPSDTAEESIPADIFAFGMLVFVVLTGRTPFAECGHLKAGLRIAAGERPEGPKNAEGVGLTPQMWRLLKMCWDDEPSQRPTIGEVIRAFEDSLGTNEHAQRTSDDRERGGSIPNEDDSLNDLQTTPPPTCTGGHPPLPNARPETKWWRRLLCAGG